MIEELDLNESKMESLIPWFRLLIASIVFLGMLAAGISGSGHWVDRSGKVMVAASLLLTFLQFRYEAQFTARPEMVTVRVRKLVQEKGILGEEAECLVGRKVAELRVRFEGVRRQVFLHALATAGIGELIAAFGDIAFLGVQRFL